MLEVFLEDDLPYGWIILISVVVTIAMVMRMHEKELKKKEEKKKKRLAELPREISAALAKAKKATGACVAMQSAATLAEVIFSEAGLDDKKSNLMDGPTEEEMLVKAGTKGYKAIEDLGHLSVEAIKLTENAEYLKLRTYARLAHAICKTCDAHLGEARCPALDILEKIDLV